MPISLYEQHEKAEKNGKTFVAASVNFFTLGFPVVPAAIAGVGTVARGVRSIPFVDNLPVVGSLLATTEQVCFETAAAGINRANLFAGSKEDSKGLEWKKYFEKLAKEAEESRQNKEYNYSGERFGKFNKSLNNIFDGTIAVASAVGAIPFKAVGGILNYTSDTITLATHLIDNVAIEYLDQQEDGINKTLGKIPKLGFWAFSTALKFVQLPISGAGQVCDSVGEALITPAKQFGNDENNPFKKTIEFLSNSKDRLEATFKASSTLDSTNKIDIVNNGVLQLYFNPEKIALESVQLKNKSYRFGGGLLFSPLNWFAEINKDRESSEKNQLRAINSEAEKISKLSTERTKALEELQKALTSEIEKELKKYSTTLPTTSTTLPTTSTTLPTTSTKPDQESIKTALIKRLNPTVATTVATTVAEEEIAEAAINSLNPKAQKALENLAKLPDGGDEEIKKLVEPASEAAKKSNNEKLDEAKKEKLKTLSQSAIQKLAKELGKKPAEPAARKSSGGMGVPGIR
jgi:hypothetical protein